MKGVSCQVFTPAPAGGGLGWGLRPYATTPIPTFPQRGKEPIGPIARVASFHDK